MYILAGFLVVGFLCNALVRPVAPKWRMNSEAVDTTAPEREASGVGVGGGFTPALGLAWALALIPIAWGVWQTLQSAIHIFQ
jgi:hypothetical protein